MGRQIYLSIPPPIPSPHLIKHMVICLLVHKMLLWCVFQWISNIRLPINSFIHSTGSHLQSSNLSEGTGSPSSVSWFLGDIMISQVHFVAWVGSSSIFFEKIQLLPYVGFVCLRVCELIKYIDRSGRKKLTVGSFKKVSVCFWLTYLINHSASCHSSSSSKGAQRDPPILFCSSSSDSTVGCNTPT